MIEVIGLSKRFGGRIALDDVSLRVDSGETVVVMGPSGCGKSTLLRCINRLVEPDSGDVRHHGASVMRLKGDDLRAYRRSVGFVFQHFHLIPHLTALENVILGPVAAGVPKDVAIRDARRALARVGLARFENALPGRLSGGERQRVAISRALVMRPKVILWDEPTASLDPIMVDEVLQIMAELAIQSETAMIVVTHEIPFALAIADRLALMDRGRIVADGVPEDVLFGSDADIARRFRRLYELRYAGTFHRLAGASGGRNSGTGTRTEPRQTNAATETTRKATYS